MTTKSSAAAPKTADEAAAPAAPTETKPVAATKPQTLTLSHHLRIDGVDYKPGDSVRVTSDYARRLRLQGYVART